MDDPAADLATIAALASSFRDRAIPARTLVLGEVGLAGEVRAVSQIDPRLGGARKSGRCPKGERAAVESRGVKLLPVETLGEALEVLFPR